MTLYPVFLKLDGLPIVVVGGGQVAASKLEGLVAAGARITVVAPQVLPAIRAHATVIDGGGPPRDGSIAAGRCGVIEREFRASDLDGARWVVAAATPEVNRAVALAAEARGLFVNAVDDPSAATAYLGGVVRRGDVEIAISTNGLAPALAGLLREALDAVLPDDLERWIDVAIAERTEHRRGRVPITERRPLLLRALDRLYRHAPEPRRAS